MGVSLKEHAKGRNVEPISSVLHVQTLDADCSGLDLAPLDGEFVDFKGQGRAIDVLSGKSNMSAMKMKMVWAHKDQSDIQATGRKRVPVIFKGDLHCRLKLFGVGDGQGSDPVAALKSGQLLIVEQVSDRMIAVPHLTTEVEAKDCCVGYVVEKITDDELEVVIYSQPVIVAVDGVG